MNLVLSESISTDALARPSIANIDRNEMQDVVISFSKSSTDGWISALEKEKDDKTTIEKWTKTIGYPVTAATSIGNIDRTNDKNLEVVVGLKNGTLIVMYKKKITPFLLPTIIWSYLFLVYP